MANWNALVWTADQDAAIRRGYESGEWGINKRLARQFGVNPRAISARAAVIGAPPLVAADRRARYHAWTPAELALVEQHLGEPIAQIRARLYRMGCSRSLASVSSIVGRKRQCGAWPGRLEVIDARNAWTVPDLAVGMGVGEYTVDRWIKSGYLRAKVMGGDKLRYVTSQALREFLTTHQAHWDHRKADKLFLVEALTFSDKNAARQRKEEAA